MPGTYNPQAWDRFAYALNNSLRYIDPTGHRACEEGVSNCLTDPPRGYGPPQSIQDLPLDLQNWIQKLVAMATGAESSNATYPYGAMVRTAWYLLNRYFSGAWDHHDYPLWEALFDDTALSKIPQIFNPLPENVKKGGWSSWQEYVNWVNETWDILTSGRHADAYQNALNATKKASTLPTSDISDFSHQKKPVDHPTIWDRFRWIKDTMELRAAVDPSFHYNSYGPFYSFNQGYWILLIGSNDPGCAQYGQCGPPWPPGTPKAY